MLHIDEARRNLTFQLWLTASLVGLLGTAFGAEQPRGWAENWPQWRGPLASGAAPLADPPLTWDEEHNVKWRVQVPGEGTSTPIVWGDRIFVLSAVESGRKAQATQTPTPDSKPAFQFTVFCLDRRDGKALWKNVAREVAPHEGHHPDHGFASASALTDGEVLLAYFGSRGLHCYDMEGKLRWSKEFNQMRTRNGFGEGSSPALYGDTIVIYQDDETDNDFIAGVDRRTGKELWRTPRNEPTGWSTPLIVPYQGKSQAVVNATGMVRSYDIATGKEIWSCAGQTQNPIPSPVCDADTVYITSGFRGSALYAIALGRTGELTGTDAIRWSRSKNTPYVPSPLLVDQLLYTVTGNNPTISCVDSRTGAPHFEAERVDGINGIYASPVAAKGRVYILGRNGTCVVLKAGPKPEILATNKLSDKTDSSIALAGRDLLIRGHQNLYCISEK